MVYVEHNGAVMYVIRRCVLPN